MHLDYMTWSSLPQVQVLVDFSSASAIATISNSVRHNCSSFALFASYELRCDPPASMLPTEYGTTHVRSIFAILCTPPVHISALLQFILPSGWWWWYCWKTRSLTDCWTQQSTISLLVRILHTVGVEKCLQIFTVSFEWIEVVVVVYLLLL